MQAGDREGGCVHIVGEWLVGGLRLGVQSPELGRRDGDCLEPPWEDTPGEMWGSLSGGVLPGEGKEIMGGRTG